MDEQADLAGYWPPFGLTITTPRLTLRVGRDHDFPAILELIERGVHAPDVMPFDRPWTDGPRSRRDPNSLRYWWTSRTDISPESWALDFFVFADGRPIGAQGVVGRNFVTLREGTTGSWLGLEFHGRGYGSEMRAAVLHFGFECLGATAMLSAAFVSNAASIGVSRKLGYEPDGFATKAPRGEPVPSQRLRLTRERWLEHRRLTDITVTGFDALRPMIGL